MKEVFIPKRNPFDKLRRKLVNWYIPAFQGNCIYPIAMRPMIEMLSQQSHHHDLVGCEIGVYRGWNAFNMLHYLPIDKLYLIDPYENSESYKMKTDPKDNLKACRRHLSKFSDKIVFIKKLSEDAVDNIPKLDFCYIDANHSYKHVKKDIELYYPKIKKGGFIGGHDFHINDIGVIYAVLEFVKENNLELQGFPRDWWIKK